jgi:hypothetical protein
MVVRVVMILLLVVEVIVPVKGPVSRLSVFSSNNIPWAPDSRAKVFFLLYSISNSPKYDRFSDAKIVQVVSMTSHARNFILLGSPFKFKNFCSYWVGQFGNRYIFYRYSL